MPPPLAGIAREAFTPPDRRSRKRRPRETPRGSLRRMLSEVLPRRAMRRRSRSCVTLAGIADQRHKGSGLAVRRISSASRQSAEKVGAGRAADAPPEPARQHVHRGDRRGIGHLQHAVDHAGNERGFDSAAGRRLRSARRDRTWRASRHAEAVEEGGMFDIGHAQPRRIPAIAEIAPDGGRGAAGAGAHHDPGRHRVRARRCICAKIDSAMLLLPRQSVARSAKVNWSMKWPPGASASAARLARRSRGRRR